MFYFVLPGYGRRFLALTGHCRRFKERTHDGLECQDAAFFPAWYDVREYKRLPSRQPDEKVIGDRLEAGELFDFLAADPSMEAKDFETDHQGVALACQAKASRATKLGTHFEGAHVAAADSNLDRHLAGNEGLGARLHVYHQCAERPCRAKTDRKAELIHCPKWRRMEASVAGDLPYVGDAVSVLIASRLEVGSDAEASDGGAISNDEAEALRELVTSRGKPDAKKPRTGNAPAGSKESSDHFARHQVFMGRRPSCPCCSLRR